MKTTIELEPKEIEEIIKAAYGRKGINITTVTFNYGTRTEGHGTLEISVPFFDGCLIKIDQQEHVF